MGFEENIYRYLGLGVVILIALYILIKSLTFQGKIIEGLTNSTTVSTSDPTSSAELSLLNTVASKSTEGITAQNNKLQDVFDQRISGTNLIAAAIWYLIFVIALFLTVVFPMDISMNQRADAILVMLIIWVPIATIYTLYLLELRSLDSTMENIIKELKKSLK